MHHEAMTVIEKQAMAVRCPTCGAKPGEKCELGTGQPRTNPIGIGAWWLRTNNALACEEYIQYAPTQPLLITRLPPMSSDDGYSE